MWKRRWVGSVDGASRLLSRPSLGRSTSRCRRRHPPGVRVRGMGRARAKGSPRDGLLLLPRSHPRPLPRTPTRPARTRTTRALPTTRTLHPPPPLIATLRGGRGGRRRGREGGRGRGSGTLVRPTPRSGGLVHTTTGVIAVGVRIGGLGRGRGSEGRVRVRGGVGEVRLVCLVLVKR